MCGKGSQQTTQQSQQQTAPNPQAMALYQDILSRAQGISNTPYQAYGGELVAGINPQQMMGIGNINAAQSWFPTATNMAYQAAQPISQADIQGYLSPYTQNVVDATQRQFANMNAQQQQQVTGNAAAQGALGGNRTGVAQAALAGQQATAQDPVVANLYNQGYSQALNTALAEQQAKLQGAYGVGNLANAQIGGANAQIGAGTLQQQTQQQQDIANYQQFMNKLAFPYQQLGWLAGLGTGVGSQMGGTTWGQQTTTAPPPSIWGQLLGLGAMGLGAYGALKNAGGRVDGPVGVANYQSGGAVQPYYTPRGGSNVPGGADYLGYATGIPELKLTSGNPWGGSLRYLDPAKQQQSNKSSTDNFTSALKGLKQSPGDLAAKDAADDAAADAADDAAASGANVGGGSSLFSSLGTGLESGLEGLGSGLAGMGSAVGEGLSGAAAGIGEGLAGAGSAISASLADLLPLFLLNRGGRANGVAGYDDGGGVDDLVPSDDSYSFDPSAMHAAGKIARFIAPSTYSLARGEHSPAPVPDASNIPASGAGKISGGDPRYDRMVGEVASMLPGLAAGPELGALRGAAGLAPEAVSAATKFGSATNVLEPALVHGVAGHELPLAGALSGFLSPTEAEAAPRRAASEPPAELPVERNARLKREKAAADAEIEARKAVAAAEQRRQAEDDAARRARELEEFQTKQEAARRAADPVYQAQVAAEVKKREAETAAKLKADEEARIRAAIEAKSQEPFHTRFPGLTTALPAIGMGAAAGVPWLSRGVQAAINNARVKDMVRSAERAEAALAANPTAAKIANVKGDVGTALQTKFHDPEHADVMSSIAAGSTAAHMPFIPLEYDLGMLKPDNPDRKAAAEFLRDPSAMGSRLIPSVIAGGSMAKLGASALPTPWRQRVAPTARLQGLLDQATTTEKGLRSAQAAATRRANAADRAAAATLTPATAIKKTRRAHGGGVANLEGGGVPWPTDDDDQWELPVVTPAVSHEPDPGVSKPVTEARAEPTTVPSDETAQGYLSQHPAEPDTRSVAELSGIGLGDPNMEEAAGVVPASTRSDVAPRAAPQQAPVSLPNTRGFRNNNPTNIEDGPYAKSQPGYRGVEPKGRFAVYDTMEHGQDAAAHLLQRYGTMRDSNGQPVNTLTRMITRWAPPSDGNNVPKYISYVSARTGIHPDATLDTNDLALMRKVSSAMQEHENDLDRLTPEQKDAMLDRMRAQNYNRAYIDSPSHGVSAAAAPSSQSGIMGRLSGLWNKSDQWGLPLMLAGARMAQTASQPGATLAGSIGAGGEAGIGAYMHQRQSELANQLAQQKLKQTAQLAQAKDRQTTAYRGMVEQRLRNMPHVVGEYTTTDKYTGMTSTKKVYAIQDKDGNLIDATTNEKIDPGRFVQQAGEDPTTAYRSRYNWQSGGQNPPVFAPGIGGFLQSPVARPVPQIVAGTSRGGAVNRQAGGDVPDDSAPDGSTPYVSNWNTPQQQALLRASQPVQVAEAEAPFPDEAPKPTPVQFPEPQKGDAEDYSSGLRAALDREHSTEGFNKEALDALTARHPMMQVMGVRNQVMQVATGMSPIPKATGKNAQLNAFIRGAAYEINPDLSEATYGRRQKTDAYYTTGVGGQQIVSFNRYLAHSASLLSIAERLHKLSALGGLAGYEGRFTDLNGVVNSLTKRGLLGPKEAQDLLYEYELNRAAVAGEGSKVFAGTNQTALQDREHWMSTLDPSMPFDSIRQTIGRGVELGIGAIQQHQMNYDAGLRHTASPREFLSPRTKKIFEAFESGKPISEALPETAGPIKNREPAAAAPAAPAAISADKRAQAEQWLRDNPNDPRAPAVRKKLGQ
jgi:hypothetical protein